MYFATRLVVYHTSKVFVGHVGDRAAGCRWGLFKSEERFKKRVTQRAVGGGEGFGGAWWLLETGARQPWRPLSACVRQCEIWNGRRCYRSSWVDVYGKSLVHENRKTRKRRKDSKQI